MKTGFVIDEAYLAHDPGRFHPESPARLQAIVDHMRDLIDTRMELIEPKKAGVEDITRVHSAGYVEHVREVCERAPAYLDSGDTLVCPASYDVALLAAGGALRAVDAVAKGEVANVFCAVRPPGHHATRDVAMGFCVFNNVAVAARYAQYKYGLKKVLVVDWDVHHGNGTQEAFYDDDTVLYFSAHRYPFYPGSGSENERGVEGGEGFTVNCPLDVGSGDREYLAALEESLAPTVDEFRPEIVLVSAGFDPHKNDPLGGMKVTVDGFAEMTRLVMGIADKHCGGRLVSVLEGGYDLTGLTSCVDAHVRALMS